MRGGYCYANDKPGSGIIRLRDGQVIKQMAKNNGPASRDAGPFCFSLIRLQAANLTQRDLQHRFAMAHVIGPGGIGAVGLREQLVHG
jgi:hypothetical protein